MMQNPAIQSYFIVLTGRRLKAEDAHQLHIVNHWFDIPIDEWGRLTRCI
jgi:enoyl-CoA hydratase/carnithine racemase